MRTSVVDGGADWEEFAVSVLVDVAVYYALRHIFHFNNS